MDKSRFEKQMEFILEIDKAKTIFRQTYLSDGKRKENDAEHSWHTAIMAFILAEYFDPDVDVLKVMKMMLMHDIIEIYAGDTYCYDDAGNATKEQREMEAAEKIYSLLPEDQAKEYKDLWLEFEAKNTREGNFCAILDRIQPIMLNYATDGRAWQEHGIYEHQVRKRCEVALNGPEDIKNWLENLIADSVNKGYIRK
ncbi:MAG: HD domain-containing protein [Lachnospiraceae bacterium]|nr:HD domain-containing protein [Lachnospiraceae bacterium]